MYQCSQPLAKVLKILCTLLESTALKPEGVLVLFAECGMGIGELQVWIWRMRDSKRATWPLILRISSGALCMVETRLPTSRAALMAISIRLMAAAAVENGSAMLHTEVWTWNEG